MNAKSLSRLLTGIAVLMASLPAVAGPVGAYMGAGTGVVVNTEEGGDGFRGIPLTVFAGVSTQLESNLYLAGEIFGNLNTATMDSSHLKTSYSWGASVLPGMVLGDHLLGFVRLGAVRNHFSWNNKTGAEVGLGMQTGLTREWDLRGEYDYIQYNSNLKTDQFAIGLVYKIL